MNQAARTDCVDRMEMYSLERWAEERAAWSTKTVWRDREVAQLMQTKRVVIAQVLDPMTHEPIVIGGAFCVLIIFGACLSVNRPPIWDVRIPCALWHMVELADWGWKHCKSLHTNIMIETVLCIPPHVRVRCVKKKKTFRTQKKLIRTTTPLNMIPTEHLNNNIVVMTIRLVDENNWGVSLPFTILADLSPISENASHYIFNPEILSWLSPFTQITAMNK